MSAITAEMEMELENELAPGAAAELEMEAPAQELEYEGEYEAEMEQESFFNHLAAMADRGGRSQALRRIGLAAGRQALRGYLKEPPPAVEGESEFESEAALETAAESNPLQSAHANAMMEHISHAAACAENEQEAAEHFLPLIPLAAKVIAPMALKLGAKVLPHIARKITPHLTRGVAQVARNLFRHKATRPLLRTMPHIVKRTMATLARHTARGGHVTPRKAVRALAHHTARVVGSPRHAVKAFRRSKALDRRYHVAARKFVGRPVGHPVRSGHWARPRPHRVHPGYHPGGYYRTGYYQPGHVRRPIYRGHPGIYRGHPGYYRPGVPAPAHAAACQCFRPVSCASCHHVQCPTCRR